jgi:hypothetical protein
MLQAMWQVMARVDGAESAGTEKAKAKLEPSQ